MTNFVLFFLPNVDISFLRHALKLVQNMTKVPNLSAATGSMAEYKHGDLKNIHGTGNKNDR